MLGNKDIMAQNIKKYMEMKGVSATDICYALDIKRNTFSDWVNAKTYPRIDKIEKMANYFGISKANLVEDELSEKYPVSKNEMDLIIQYRGLNNNDRETFERLLKYAKAATERMNKDGTIQ